MRLAFRVQRGTWGVPTWYQDAVHLARTAQLKTSIHAGRQPWPDQNDQPAWCSLSLGQHDLA